MVEIGVLGAQCLNRRFSERTVVETKIKAWQQCCNESAARIKWKFATRKARNKPARAYSDPTKVPKPL
jgi:hypothetical protein